MTTITTGEGYRSVWMDLYDVPFEHGWVDIDGVRTRYMRASDPGAPTVVMLHGTAGSLDTFAPTIKALHGSFHCLAIDMIESGFTDKPDRDIEIADYVAHALGVLDHFGIERASFVGVSMGAWVSARFALDHPERTERQILLSPSGLLVDLGTLNRIRTGRTMVAENPTWENAEETISRLLHAPSSILPDIVALRQKMYQLPHAARSMAHVLCLSDPPVRQRNNLTEEQWRSIQAPTLVIVSVDAGDMWTATGYAIAKLLPAAQMVEMREVNHWPHFERPEEFNALALEFLTAS